MKETPIIMSGNHPKLILDGIKTQTRRVIKPQPTFYEATKNIPFAEWVWMKTPLRRYASHLIKGLVKYCPYGQVGDRLWLREAWYTDKVFDGEAPSKLPDYAQIYYASDYYDFGKGSFNSQLRPSIFMPRWASRITLEITDVRVERLNQMTEADVTKEGVDNLVTFMLLWDRLNKKRGYEWKSNCWVWVITFKLCR